MRKQTSELITLLEMAQPLSHYYLFMEDDFRYAMNSLSCAAFIVGIRFTAARVLLHDDATVLGTFKDRPETTLCPVLPYLQVNPKLRKKCWAWHMLRHLSRPLLGHSMCHFLLCCLTTDIAGGMVWHFCSERRHPSREDSASHDVIVMS